MTRGHIEVHSYLTDLKNQRILEFRAAARGLGLTNEQIQFGANFVRREINGEARKLGYDPKIGQVVPELEDIVTVLNAKFKLNLRPNGEGRLERSPVAPRGALSFAQREPSALER